MRVLHVTHSLVAGGAETQLQLLLNTWPYSDIELGVFYVQGQPADIVNSVVQQFPAGAPSTHPIAILKSINRTVKQFDPEVIHIWLPECVSIPAMVVGRYHDRKVILSFRGRRTLEHPRTLLEAALAMLCVDSIVSNHEVLKSSAYRRSIFRWLFKHKRSMVIRNGLTLNEVELEDSPPSHGKYFQFICVGRLTPAKNYHRLVEALTSLAGRTDWVVDIWGEGESRRSLQQFIDLSGLGDRVRLRGFSASVLSEMRSASALILPSLSEGMPNVLLEAMAVGTLVIAADIEGIREVVGNEQTCVLVNPLDTRDIARGLSDVMNGQVDKLELVSRGRQVAARYNIRVAQASYREHYRQLSGFA